MTREDDFGVHILNLPYGDGWSKIFGMENFGNTCFCNSILQCLFYTEKFRAHLASQGGLSYDKKGSVYGVQQHPYVTKYEHNLKKTRELIKSSKILSNNANNDRPKSSRKSGLFGIKLNSGNTGSNSNNNGNFTNSNSSVRSLAIDVPSNVPFVKRAKECTFLTAEQKLRIKKFAELRNMELLITRTTGLLDKSENDMLFMLNSDSYYSENNALQEKATKGDLILISPLSSIVVVGIPQPDPSLNTTYQATLQNPSIDQRKRAALQNGPIINLDHPILKASNLLDDSDLLFALKDIYECIIENDSQIGVVSPNYFISKLRERNILFSLINMHHDAHEFFNYLLNVIIEYLDKYHGHEVNWANQLFQGLITNETKCLQCETVTSRDEEFLDLSIDIPGGESSFSLTYALNNFSKKEILTQQNKFYCSKCAALQEALKTIKLKSLPEILVINLKRFKYDEEFNKVVKLFDTISYPLKLRLFNTTTNSGKSEDGAGDGNFSLYELYALVVHIGGGPLQGHYVSLCKNKAGLWFLFDDETVELVDEAYVLRFFGCGPGLASAYILFYQKCNTMDEDEVDFGFNPHDLYDGNDLHVDDSFENSDFTEPSSDRVNTSASLASVLEQDSFHEGKPENISTTETFVNKEDSQNKSKDDDISLNKSKNKETKKADTLKENDSNAAIGNSENSSKPEKKTWVAGLKRRESKLIPNLERRNSFTSIIAGTRTPSNKKNTNTGDKKKSIFNLKRWS